MALRRSSDIVGKVVDGYQIEKELGRGGMGIVYKAVDTSLDRVVALKVMNPLLVEDEQFFRRFKAEAKALGRLKHPNIVGVFTLRHTEDYLFIVMEYVDGGTLMDLILHHKAIPWHNTVPIIQQTLNAVDYAHRQHVIHRDIKPRNILITSSGIAKVTDFGLAKIQDLSVATRALTRTGITGGTLYYMPPEQLEGLLKVDHRGDIYSLGMTYYVMLAGRSPFEKLSSEFAILKAIDAHDFPALGQLDTDIPEPLVRMVMKAVERDPSDRFQSAGEMLGAMQAWLVQSSSDIPALSATRLVIPSPTRPISRRRKRKRERDTNRRLKTMKAWLANARSKAGSQETSGRQSAKKERFPTLEPLQARSTLPRTQVAPQPPEPQPLVTELQHEPAPTSEVLPEPETPQEPDAVPEQEPLRGPEDLPEKEHRESTPSEPHTARPLWKRPVFGASLAAVLLAVLSFALFQTLIVSTSGRGGGPMALANLTIRTVPEEVNVYLNEEPLGSTPLMDYPTSAGTMALRLESDGYIPVDTSITVAANETLTLSFQLHPLREDIEASESDEPPEEIASDDAPQDEQPKDQGDQPEDQQGLGQIEDLVADYANAPQLNDSMVATEATPGPVMGKLRIGVRPYGDIYINGVQKASGTSRRYEVELPEGAFRVRAVHPKLGSWEKEFVVRAGDTQEFTFNFNQRFQVRVLSVPTNAQIIVDGIPQENKYAPVRISLPPGQHTIAVLIEGYVMVGAAQTITLEDNIKETLSFTLRKKQ